MSTSCKSSNSRSFLHCLTSKYWPKYRCANLVMSLTFGANCDRCDIWWLFHCTLYSSAQLSNSAQTFYLLRKVSFGWKLCIKSWNLNKFPNGNEADDGILLIIYCHASWCVRLRCLHWNCQISMSSILRKSRLSLNYPQNCVRLCIFSWLFRKWAYNLAICTNTTARWPTASHPSNRSHWREFSIQDSSTYWDVSLVKFHLLDHVSCSIVHF